MFHVILKKEQSIKDNFLDYQRKLKGLRIYHPKFNKSFAKNWRLGEEKRYLVV
jgi:hypothetical protein